MLHSSSKATAPGKPPTRRPSNRHRKEARGHMGKFAKTAAQHDVGHRGDGVCVAGKWIADNFDDEDLAEFVRLVKGHKWDLIERLSDGNLKENSLGRHVHGTCICINDDTPGRSCCGCDKTREDS